MKFNSSSRILNIFSKDIYSIDQTLPRVSLRDARPPCEILTENFDTDDSKHVPHGSDLHWDHRGRWYHFPCLPRRCPPIGLVLRSCHDVCDKSAGLKPS